MYAADRRNCSRIPLEISPKIDRRTGVARITYKRTVWHIDCVVTTAFVNEITPTGTKRNKTSGDIRYRCDSTCIDRHTCERRARPSEWKPGKECFLLLRQNNLDCAGL